MNSRQTTVRNESRLPKYMRAKEASAYFQIAKSTLWYWVKTRPGFPQPLKAGEKVTLFDIHAIEKYLKEGVHDALLLT